MSDDVYISKQAVYCQENPRIKCRHAMIFLYMSVQNGFFVRCRNQRCSCECNQNAANKLRVCFGERHEELKGENLTLFRGCLKMPRGTDPETYQHTKDLFLRSLRRWAKRHGYTVQLHGKIDFSSRTDFHYDILLITDAPITTLREFYSKSWREKGESHYSLVPVEPGYVQRAFRYHAKGDVKGKVFIPKNQNEFPLDLEWSTRGFWGPNGKEGLWIIWVEKTIDKNPCPNTKSIRIPNRMKSSGR